MRAGSTSGRAARKPAAAPASTGLLRKIDRAGLGEPARREIVDEQRRVTPAGQRLAKRVAVGARAEAGVEDDDRRKRAAPGRRHEITLGRARTHALGRVGEAEGGADQQNRQRNCGIACRKLISRIVLRLLLSRPRGVRARQGPAHDQASHAVPADQGQQRQRQADLEIGEKADRRSSGAACSATMRLATEPIRVRLPASVELIATTSQARWGRPARG